MFTFLAPEAILPTAGDVTPRHMESGTEQALMSKCVLLLVAGRWAGHEVLGFGASKSLQDSEHDVFA